MSPMSFSPEWFDSFRRATPIGKDLVLVLVVTLASIFLLPPAPLHAQDLPAGVELQAGADDRASEKAVEARSRTVRPKMPVTLFSTYAGVDSPGAFAITNQSFLDIFLDPPTNSVVFATVLGDDFTVTGSGWRIETVYNRGLYFAGTGPVSTVDVFFVADAGGAPATTDLEGASIAAYPALAYTDLADGDLIIPLVDGMGQPAPLELPPGTYWLVLRPRMPFALGQYGWTESSAGVDTGTTLGAESVFMQNAPFIPGTDGSAHCVGDWGARVTDCLMTRPMDPGPHEKDLAFRLEGVVLTPGVQVTPTSIQTSEAGATASFEVVLTAIPAAQVDVPIGAAPGTEGTVSVGMLSFTDTNWDVPQTVTVTPVDDVVPEATAMYVLSLGPTSSGDPAFDNLAVPDVTVENLDDDAAGFSVVPTSGLSISETGTTDTFDIRLNAPLGAGEQATVPLSVTPVGVATVPATVVFTDADGVNPRTITVTPGDDMVADGPTPFTVVTGDPTSDNAVYDALGAADVANVTGTRLDDDVAGFVVTAPSPIALAESGAMVTIQVAPRSIPTADVTVQVFASDGTEGQVVPNTLVFTPANGTNPLSFDVSSVDDDLDDGDRPWQAIFQPADSADVFYLDLVAPPVSVSTIDDDVAGFVVSPTDLVTGEDGTMDSFTIVATAEPQFTPVDLPLTVDDVTEGLLSLDAVTTTDSLLLSFDSADWDVPRTIYVHGVDDFQYDGDILHAVRTGAPGGGDPAYVALGAAGVDDVAVVNLDDESVDIPVLDPAGLLAMVLLLTLAGAVLLRR